MIVVSPAAYFFDSTVGGRLGVPKRSSIVAQKRFGSSLQRLRQDPQGTYILLRTPKRFLTSDPCV